MEERDVAVGLEKKGGGRKKELEFCTVQAHHQRFVLQTAVMRGITAGSNGHYGHLLLNLR